MKAPDYFLLEFLAEEGLSSPSDIASDGRIPYGRTYINQRLIELDEHGFTRNAGNGMYQLTERGQEWLAGDFDARILDEGEQGKPTT